MIVNYGEALDALKDGKKVARKGWNGKGMSVELVRGAATPDGRVIADFKALNAADGKLMPWVTSQADDQAVDWQIV